MDKLKERAKAFGLVVFLVGSFCYASTMDWAEQVTYTMPAKANQEIRAKLGSGCSQYDIAQEYIHNKKYYDALR